jgi:hypothetical protein
VIDVVKVDIAEEGVLLDLLSVGLGSTQPADGVTAQELMEESQQSTHPSPISVYAPFVAKQRRPSAW